MVTLNYGLQRDVLKGHKNFLFASIWLEPGLKFVCTLLAPCSRSGYTIPNPALHCSGLQDPHMVSAGGAKQNATVNSPA